MLGIFYRASVSSLPFQKHIYLSQNSSIHLPTVTFSVTRGYWPNNGTEGLASRRALNNIQRTYTHRLPKIAQYSARRPFFSFQHLAGFQKRSIHMTHLRTHSSVLSFCAPLLIFQPLLPSLFLPPSPRPLSRPLELSLSIIIWAHTQQLFFFYRLH